MEIIYRKAIEQDKEGINKILKENFGDNHVLDKVYQEDDKYSYVAIDDEKVVGYVNVTIIYNEIKKEYWAKLNYVCVDKDYRHQGIATALLEELEKNEKKAKYFELTCRRERENAHKLYNKLGYEQYDTDLLRKNINL